MANTPRFRDLACDHLARYKVSALGVRENGLFSYRGRIIPKAHILPIANLKANILEKYRSRFFASEHGNIKLHRYFHHLNSSQALCINLFYPLIAENELGLLLNFLELQPADEMLACFERASGIEIAARRTSFDFHIRYAAGHDVFAEVKYTEDGFGKAKDDEEHRNKFHKTYLPLVDKSAFLVPECRNVSFFLEHYQLLRNLVHIRSNAHVVLLFPSANGNVAKQAVYAKERLLTRDGFNKLKIVCLEGLLDRLEEKCAGGPLDGYYADFRAKYLPAEVNTDRSRPNKDCVQPT